MSAGAAPGTIDAAYDIERMYQYLDYVHVMCYDYHGKWDKKTGHNAPLRPRSDESAEDQTLNVDYTLQYLIQLGARPEKTVLGVPLYGRAFTLEDSSVNNMGAPAKDTSFQVRLKILSIYLKHNVCSSICVTLCKNLLD